MGAALLQLPQAASHAGEAALVLGVPFPVEVAGGAERQVDALVEVVTGLAVPPNDVLGDVFGEEGPRLVEERLVVVCQLHA